jgi:hypothetical protein
MTWAAASGIFPMLEEWDLCEMRKARVISSVVAAAMSFAAVAQARGPACVKAEEVFPIDTALIQQELMVAALTCHEVERFNAFQTGYGRELRDTDSRLAHVFHRLYGARGEAAYHAFKTKAANEAEMRSIHNNPGYCAEAGALFSAALVPMRPSLVTFVSASQSVIGERPVVLCASGGSMATVRVIRHRRRHRE